MVFPAVEIRKVWFSFIPGLVEVSGLGFPASVSAG